MTIQSNGLFYLALQLVSSDFMAVISKNTLTVLYYFVKQTDILFIVITRYCYFCDLIMLNLYR